MKLHLQYLSDPKGTPTAVVIPINEWEKYEREHLKLQQYLKLKTSLTSALTEVELFKKGKKKLSTLTDFLKDEKAK